LHCLIQYFSISNLYEFIFWPLHMFLMSGNRKYWGCVKYNIRVLFFGSPWIHCINYFWSTRSWFSCWKTISNLYVSISGPLRLVFMRGNGEYWGCVKYSIGVLFYGYPWIHCINYFRSRKSWFSRWKTISDLYVCFSLATSNFFHK